MSGAAASARPLSDAERARFPWMTSTPAAPIMAALEAARVGGARFVGGCVRDSLLGVAPKDIDVATTLMPDEVVRALSDAGLRSAPTGIEHGTVTGIVSGAGVEITTLRADVSTDGRRATVAFTADWAVDARRRDFTINALYVSPQGEVFDPAGGLEDLASRRVRFIDAPRDRIREDYLRILRFFRFSARFAEGFDEEGLRACAEERAGLKRLSAERVGDEMSKILALPRASFAVAAMAEQGILAEVWAAPPALVVFERLKRLATEAAAPLGLAALWGAAGEGIDAALRLSNADAGRRRGALKASQSIRIGMEARDARAARYRAGPDAFRDGALLAAAREGAEPSRLASLLAIEGPIAFPLTGKDVIALGAAPGPAVAAILKAAEERWIEEDFPDKARAAELLRAAAKDSRSSN